jgi:hypothetical protein
MLERRLLLFLEVEAELAGCEAAVAVRLLPRHQCGQLERLGHRHAAISRAVTSARTRLSCSSARRRIVRGWPARFPPRAERHERV